jgi:hypothetical protein
MASGAMTSPRRSHSAAIARPRSSVT